MFILGNRGYKCNKKYINIIGSTNIDCINKFIREYNNLVDSSNYIGIILENIDLYEDLQLKERLNTVKIYNDIYNISYKNCLDINRVLNNNGTIEKINNLNELLDSDNEFNLIIDYFNDYNIFINKDNYSLHNIDNLNNRYNTLSKVKRR